MAGLIEEEKLKPNITLRNIHLEWKRESEVIIREKKLGAAGIPLLLGTKIRKEELESHSKKK